MTRNWIKRGLIASRLTRLAGSFRGPQAVILMYHSVLDQPEREFFTLGRIMHSTEIFTKQMEVIARHYAPVSMDDVLLFTQGQKQLPARAVAVTFDDGYLDNYQVALPILNRLGVPATFYVTVECIETGKLPWPSRLRYAFFTTHRKSWKDEHGNALALESPAQRDQAFLQACDLGAKLSGHAQEQFVRGIESELEAALGSNGTGLMMNWDHARALVAKGHIVGSHTMTHPNMAYVPDSEAEVELTESKHRTEQALGTPIAHFSYPCPALQPHWKPSTVELSRKAGYRTAVTTNGGPVRRNDDPLRLRRARPSRDVDGLRWNLECAFLGRTV